MSNAQFQKSKTSWQLGFIALLPEIEGRLHSYFRDLKPDARENAFEDALIHCLLNYVRLFERGRAGKVSASSLAWYAVLQVRKGREAACPLNSKEPLSRYAKLSRNFHAIRVDECDPASDLWIQESLDDRRMSVADQVAIRIDMGAWLASLCRRSRDIAVDLATGHCTAEVGRKYRISSGRVSQLRRELQQSWQQFQGEAVLASTG